MGFFKDALSVAAPIVGNMIAPGIGGQIGSMVGGAISGRQMSKQAGETAAQYDARMRQLGAQGAFKPVATKTLFGQSNYKVDPITGQLLEAGYTASDSVKADQERFENFKQAGLASAEQAIPFAQQYGAPAQGLFNLGQEYLSETPEQARQTYMQQQMDALRPYDVEEEQRLLAMGFGRGTTGLSVGAGGNPMLKALQEGRNRRGLQLAANAEQAAQQQIGFGTQQLAKASGLMGTGYDLMQGSLAPYQSYLSNQAKLEELAQQPYTMGLNAGATAMTGQQFGANMGKAGAGVTAQQQLAAAQRKNEMMQGLFEGDLLTDAGSAIKTGIGKIGGLFGGGSSMIPGGGFGGGQAVPYSSGMSTPGLMFGQRSY
jgi:hypothetical protein